MPVISTIAAATARAFGAFKAAAGGAADEFFNYVTLLLHGDGTNGAQNNTFLDSSTNNFTITRNGNTTQGTFSPFSQDDGKWGVYFDGSGDYCTFSSNTPMDFGTGAFTIEGWVYTGDKTVSVGASRTIIGNSGNSYTMQLYIDSSVGKLVFGNTGSTNLQGTSNIANNAWNHVVVVRSGTGSNQTALFVNGAREAVGTNTQNYTSGTIYLGAFDTGNGFWNGFISNLRIVKGTAVYDPTQTTLTVPTTPLTAITNTSLLTCQSNRFKDNSANNFAITVNGNTSIQPFSPFAPSAAYSAATNGGSGYFDGSGDYLTVASNAAFATPADFTWEAWVYRTTTSDDVLYSGNVTDAFVLQIISNAAVVRQFGVANLITSSATVPTYAWTHIAVARSGTTLSLWINGSRTSGGTTTNSTSFAQNGLLIGVNDIGTNYLDGYLSGLRLVKGTAVYDPTQTTITVPTAPPTAITNTSFLANFTNAGILDNTGRNDLETVGNAQISTSVKKFGTGSLAFDGTGDYLVTNAPSSDLFAFGTGNFTVEMWIYFNSLATSVILDWRDASTIAAFPLLVTDSNTILWSHTNNTRITSGTVSTGQWYHLAICRSGTDTKMFLNGTQTGSTYSDSTAYLSTAGAPRVGIDRRADAYYLNGYIDDLRITKGVARYTSAFTPPTAAFEDQ